MSSVWFESGCVGSRALLGLVGAEAFPVRRVYRPRGVSACDTLRVLPHALRLLSSTLLEEGVMAVDNCCDLLPAAWIRRGSRADDADEACGCGDFSLGAFLSGMRPALDPPPGALVLRAFAS